MTTEPEREQALVFGEVAEQYDAERPTYPEAVFDAIVEYGSLRAGDAALEIGAGTGKATQGFVDRGLAVHAIEPSAGMARVLRTKGVEVEETTFEDWPLRPGAFRLVFAAQAWHWVQGADRFEKVATALEPGGTVALFWNMGRDHPEPFKTDNDALYDKLVPGFNSSIGGRAKPAELVADFARPEFEPIVERTITWQTSYTSAEWIRMLGTHSDHRMLPDDLRNELHTGIGRVIDEHGGRLVAIYDVMLYLATRR